MGANPIVLATALAALVLAVAAPTVGAVDPVDYAGNTAEAGLNSATNNPCGGEMWEYHEDTNQLHWHPQFYCFPPP